MNQLDQVWQALWTTEGGGIALIVIALVLRALAPTWTWLRAVVMLGGGIVIIRLMAYVLGTAIANKDDKGWLQDLFHGIAWASGLIPAAGGLFRFIFDKLGTNLTWIVAAILVMWTLVHMFPRIWNLLRRKAAAQLGGHRGAAAEREAAVTQAGRVSTLNRTSTKARALHAARHHTTWVALLTPAAVALVPPLAIAWNMGGMP